MAYSYAHGGIPPYQPIITKDKIWWDNWNGQEILFFDEFDGTASYSRMKIILDQYDDVGGCETKGSTAMPKFKAIIINSNKTPAQWWPGEELEPLYRRIRDSGGCVATWSDNRVEEFKDNTRVHDPDIFQHTGPNFLWKRYPDPPDSGLAETNGTYSSIVLTIHHAIKGMGLGLK